MNNEIMEGNLQMRAAILVGGYIPWANSLAPIAHSIYCLNDGEKKMADEADSA